MNDVGAAEARFHGENAMTTARITVVKAGMRNDIHDQLEREHIKASVGSRVRQLMVAALGVALVYGCSSRQASTPGADAAGFLGAVVADEPQAALVGRDILIAGGSAADAVIAMYFAAAVTLPSQASLGGGGMCISFNSVTNEAQALDFLAGPSTQTGAEGDRPTAIPGNVRGFYALHGVYGRLRWPQLLAPAENLARFGVQVSRALSNDLAPLETALAREPQMRRLFSAEGGRRMVVEGDTLVQPDLASALASVRTSGPGDFYSGGLAERFLKGVHDGGGSLNSAELADYQPIWRKPLMVGFDDKRAYFAPPPPAGGVIAGQMWSMLVKDDRFERASPTDRDMLVVAAAERAFADRQRWASSISDWQNLVSSARVDALLAQPANATRAEFPADEPATENPAAATLVAIDAQGSSVACAVTLNSLLGTGRIATGTGIILAASPGQGGRGAAMLGPMVVVKPSGRQFVFAGAASGGVAAPTALIDVARRVLLADQPLDEAQDAARLHGGSDTQIIYVEPGADARSTQALVDRGYTMVKVESLGRVNAISCPGGLQSSPERCVAATDPRGFGLAASTK
jgi:gamma-glutamyltranspeptidase/glutathione hydrolase